MRVTTVLAAVLVAGVLPSTTSAQPSATETRAAAEAPVPPNVVTRNAAGRATIRAVRLTEPMKVDGRLDEAVYGSVPPVGGFTQVEPTAGAPGTQKTECWLLFDKDNVYVSLRVFEDHLERMVANEMRHDAAVALSQNELITVALDTFKDERSAYAFYINPIGGRGEGQSNNESQFSNDWNGIWKAEVGRFAGGWTVEMAIPFKTLRYPSGAGHVWGLQVQRLNRWKNEIAFVTPSDPARGSSGFMLASKFASVVGIEGPPPAVNLDVKPYAIADLTTDHTTSPPRSNDGHADAGIDLKYGIKQSLAADFTYNTDFAQVEADEQQVNLTRFSLFFPEKREFFLENSGTFSFGGIATNAAADAPVLFYSRRIGLNGSAEVPLRMGGRLTGRLQRYSIGVIDIQGKDEPVSGALATNFSVVRVKRDILRRSAIGAMFSERSVAQSTVGSNQVYGVDSTFAFFTNLAFNAYWAKSATTGRTGDDSSYRGQVDYPGDRYGLQAEYLRVGANFNPEVGFLRRADIQKRYVMGRFSPRPRRNTLVRKYTWLGSNSYIENGTGRVESKALIGEFDIDFQNSDKLTLSYTGTYEFLPRPFVIAPRVVLPVGGYDYDTVLAAFGFGQQRRIFGKVTLERGTFYDGHRTTVTLSGGRVRILPQFSLEPTASFNSVDLKEGAFRANLVGSRVTYTMTPLMFVSALVQYNSSSHTVASNVRLRWEYLPGSELFVVYNDQRDTQAPHFPGLINRSLIVKVNRLLRF